MKKTILVFGILIVAGISFWYFFLKKESIVELCLQDKEASVLCTQVLVEQGLGDESACLEISDKGRAQSACYYHAAKYIKDINICEKIGDPDWRATCLTVVKGDPSSCDNLMSDEIMKDYWIGICYEDLAKIKKDLSLCGYFKDSSGYIDCYQGVANYYKDIKICEGLKSINNINTCKWQFKNYQKGYE